MLMKLSGQTTIVTGASSGIGAAFARELARRGSDLVLVARRAERLTALAAELGERHGVHAEVASLDLGAGDAAAQLRARCDESGLRISGLVNCAGFSTWGPFHEEDADRVRVELELEVDVASLVSITRAFIADLRAGEGILVNVASMAAYGPVPNMAVYAASKAFVLSFTEALWYESRDTGLRVLALSPGATRTEFFDEIGEQAAGGTAMETPEAVVRTAMRALERRAPSAISGRRNRFSEVALRALPRPRRIELLGRMTAGPTPALR